MSRLCPTSAMDCHGCGGQKQLEQVVLNLLINAEQALEEMSEDRRLIVRTRSGGSGEVFLEVIDNGPGIPRQNVAQIFDPFFTTKDPGRGTGLGLSLVQTLVQTMGGTVRVKSRQGRGATFAVELPGSVGDHGEVGEPAIVPSANRRARVLVVDDEPAMRRILSLYLKRIGHVVVEADDGVEALRRLEEADFDLILCDIRMAGMDGETLLHHVANEYPRLRDRFAFITGDTASPTVAAFVGRASAPVLMKPFDLEQVAALVEQLA